MKLCHDCRSDVVDSHQVYGTAVCEMCNVKRLKALIETKDKALAQAKALADNSFNAGCRQMKLGHEGHSGEQAEMILDVMRRAREAK